MWELSPDLFRTETGITRRHCSRGIRGKQRESDESHELDSERTYPMAGRSSELGVWGGLDGVAGREPRVEE